MIEICLLSWRDGVLKTCKFPDGGTGYVQFTGLYPTNTGILINSILHNFYHKGKKLYTVFTIILLHYQEQSWQKRICIFEQTWMRPQSSAFWHIWWLSVFPRVASGSSISNLVSPPWSPSFQAGHHRTPSHWTWPQPWTFRSWIWPSGHSRRNAWQRHIAKYICASSLIYLPKHPGNVFSTQLPLAS